MWCEPKPRRALTSAGNSRSAGISSTAQVGGEAIPCSTKKRWAASLSSHIEIVSGPGSSTGAPTLVAARREHAMVEVGERDDQRRLVLGDEPRDRLDVARVVETAGTNARRSAAYSAGASGFRSTASVVAPARPKAVTMSTR